MFYGHSVFLVTHSQTPRNYLKHQMTDSFPFQILRKSLNFLRSRNDFGDYLGFLVNWEGLSQKQLVISCFV